MSSAVVRHPFAHLLTGGLVLLFLIAALRASEESGQTAEATVDSAEAVDSAGEEHSHSHSSKLPEDPVQRREWLIQELQERQQNLATLKEQAVPPLKTEDRVLFLTTYLEHGILHPQSSGEKTQRFLVGELHVINNTDQPVSISREQLQLQLDNQQSLAQSPISEKLRGRTFQIENSRTMSLGSLERPDRLIVPAGETGSTWFYFQDFEAGAMLPKDSRLITTGQPKLSLNLQDEVCGQLRLRRERIGPDGALGILKIGSRVNIIGLSIMVDQLDQLLEQGVDRDVIIWDESVKEIDSTVMRFLYESAREIGQQDQNRRRQTELPEISGRIQELHLVHTPGHNYSSSQPRVTHDEPITAVAASLSSLLSLIPETVLLQQIQSGHPWVRPVALSAGAATLSPDQLGMVLELSRQTADEALQKAAVDALSEFGHPAAVERLLELAESSHETLTPLAIAGLTQSRFETGHTALNQLVKTAEGPKRQQLLKVIAEYPSPAFAELYFENVLNTESEIRVEALQALDAVGHDNFSELLRRCLDDSDDALREAAFNIALDRKIPELEPLLADRVLEQLAKGNLDSSIQSYLRSTKLPRAIPYLIQRLAKNSEDSKEIQMLVPILSDLGDDRIEPLFAKIYPQATGYQKRQILEALGHIQSPRFLKYAREALSQEDNSLIYTAINTLSKFDSREAEQILIDGLDLVKSESYYDNLANAIAQIGTEEAEEALRKKRHSEDPKMRQAAINGLRYMERRKPSYNYLSQSRYRMRQQKWSEALDYIKIALEIDAQLATAHSQKGDILLKLKKVADAERSYQKAVAVDPDCGEAIVGLLRVQARRGQFQATLDTVEKLVPRFHQDPDFEVQTGLLYADAVNLTLNRDPDAPEKDPTEKDATEEDQPDPDNEQKETTLSAEQEQQVEFWTKECLSWISNGIAHGYSDRNLIRSLPEIQPFSKHLDYQKAVNGQLPIRKIETDEKGVKQTGLSDTTEEGDFVILQVGAEVGDGDDVVIDLPPPPAR
ncbi:MAG: HEAT repeat domain-containing protein [Planctomycetaceae bacterium]|nr:HEAT repeat domain-containing protein [Planctomycetaceae bacterium]